MNAQWFAPDQLFDGQNIRTGLAVEVADNKIRAIGPAPDIATPIRGCLTPGFIDLQVNGGGGVQFNTTPSHAGITKIAAAHRQFGTVGLMPTVITDHPDVLDAAADAAISAKHDQGILGLHIEGPHIAQARRGTHDMRHIRPLDARTIGVVRELRDTGVRVMVTLAPEAATNNQIKTLSEMGAIVSLGHTNATADEVDAAIAAGATCATHLFNAMSPMTSREPGAVGAVMNAKIFAGLICDGHHVDDRMIQIALRARPVPDKTFLVSDAMATVGGPDEFALYGSPVRLRDGRLINSEGNLAGAHTTLAEGLKRLIHEIGLAPERALRMVTSVPAAAIGAERYGRLRGCQLSDVLVLDAAYALNGTLAEQVQNATTIDAAE